MLPTCLSIWSFLRQRWRQVQRKRRRQYVLQRTISLLQSGYTKQLEEADRVAKQACSGCHAADDNDCLSDDEVSPHTWKLPSPGTKLSIESRNDNKSDNMSNIGEEHQHGVDLGGRFVGGSCAICLNHYQGGHSIVWAPNPKCIHVIHQDCIIQWFTRKRQGSGSHRNNDQQCPCCRQSFVVDVMDS